jgi:hypothetical protein
MLISLFDSRRLLREGWARVVTRAIFRNLVELVLSDMVFKSRDANEWHITGAVYHVQLDM